MTEQNSPLDRDTYCCSICLELLRHPGTLACGHSYCLGCITVYWNTEDERGVYSCPQCRQTITPRPSLEENTELAAAIKHLEETKLPGAPPDRYAGPGEVGCDVCTGRKMKVFKSCLDCLASYCEEHLQGHYQVAGLRRHRLVEPTTDLQENICPRHDEVIKIFCCQDRQTICYLCSIDEHKGHRTVSAEAERHKRQKFLGGHQNDMQLKIRKAEEDVKVLQQEMGSINRTADEAVKYNEKISVEMIRSIQGWTSKVNGKIRAKEKIEVYRVLDLQGVLEQNIADMRQSAADLQCLSHTQSHITFLRKYPWDLKLREHTGLHRRDVHPMQYFQNVTEALGKMTNTLEVFLKKEFPLISRAVAQVDVFLAEQPESKTRKEFLQYSYDITIDPNSKTKYLSLSEDNRKVTAGALKKERLWKKGPVQPDWAMGKCLSMVGLTGRQYWELEWEADDVSISVGYKDYTWSREFGNDDKSWTLNIKTSDVEFKHNNISIQIPGPSPSRVGVYLDYRAGILCFYNISDKMTLLQKVQTTFTLPLYAGIWLNPQTGGTVEFCYPLKV